MFTMLTTNIVSDKPENKFAPYERMAAAIFNLTKKNGECWPQDLLQHGFTKQETIDLWHMANAMALVELRLMESQNMTESKVRHHA